MSKWLNLLLNYLSLPLACHASPVTYKTYSFLLACLDEFHTLLWKVRSLQLQQEPIFNLFGAFSPWAGPAGHCGHCYVQITHWGKSCVKPWSSVGFTCQTAPSQRLSCDMPRELLPGCTVPGMVLLCWIKAMNISIQASLKVFQRRTSTAWCFIIMWHQKT